MKFYSLLLGSHQKHLRILSAVLQGFRVIVKEDVDMISPYTAASVLGSVDHSVDHDLGAVGNYIGVNGDGMAGAGHGSGAGVAAPALGAADAGAVAEAFSSSAEAS